MYKIEYEKLTWYTKYTTKTTKKYGNQCHEGWNTRNKTEPRETWKNNDKNK